jgi:hypothetical protein
MRNALVVLLLALLPACGRDGAKDDEHPPPESRIEPSAPLPEDSRPFPEGYTQRPPKNAPWLPPAPPPLVDAISEENPSGAARDAAQSEILALVAEFEREGSLAIVSRIREVVTVHVTGGNVSYRSGEAFYKEYIYPRDIDEADSAYRGRVVVLTGSVAPHNMLDLPDGFKLYEQTPYVHEPVLLATDFELAFIRCHLARKELQKLLDWQEVHIFGVVEGKLQSDLVLRRCVVL